MMDKNQIQRELKNKNAQQQMRVVRGYAIISKGDTPKQIGKEAYTVPSQNGNGEYTVIKNGKWECSCPDYQKRKMDCKHISAVRLFLEIQKKVKEDSLIVEEVKQKPKCVYCGCEDVIKASKRITKTMIKQRFRCNGCKRTFIQDKDFQRIKGDSKITTMMLDLYFKGISFRGIQDHLNQFYNLSIDHSNIVRRVHKFSRVINNYVKELKPTLGEVWHTDEMKIQAGGKWKWLWNVMDEESRYLISQMVTDGRKQEDSKAVFKQAKDNSKDQQPKFMITDGCHSYNSSITSELPQTSHIQLKTIKDHVNNNIVERLNGTVRDRIKTMRGMQNIKTSENLMDGFANYYNHIKIHSALGTTPAIKSGLSGNLEGNRWEQLIRKSLG